MHKFPPYRLTFQTKSFQGVGMIRTIKNCALATLLLTSSAAIAQDSGWVISEADGQVSITRGDKGVYGAKGTALQVGDVVRTSKAAKAVLARGDEFFILAPNKQVRIAPKEESGALAQVMEFVGGMFASNTKQTRFSASSDAAVVKGLDGKLGKAKPEER